MNRLNALYLASLALLVGHTAFAADPAHATGYDVSIGLGLGADFPGAQDLKFKRYDATGTRTDYLVSKDVKSSVEPVEMIDATVWSTQGTFDGYGVRLQLANWDTRATAKELIAHIPDSATPPFKSVDESQLALFGTVAHRWSLTSGRPAADSPNVYVGLGYGPTRTAVTHGDTRWRLGFEGYTGLCIPLTPDIRFRTEALWLVTQDADVSGAPADWRVDTSGKHWWGHSTWDTRFYVITAGLEFKL